MTMKKSLLAVMVLALAVVLASCDSNEKKLKEATQMLELSFTTVDKFPLQEVGLKPVSLALVNNELQVKVAMSDSVMPLENYSYDKWIKPCVVKVLLGGAINTMALSKKLDSPKDGNPSKEYLQLLKEVNGHIKLTMDARGSSHDYEISADEASKLLEMPSQQYNELAAAGAFLSQMRIFRMNKTLSDVKLDDKECQLVLDSGVDRSRFVKEMGKMPALLAYVMLYGLELKVNDTVVPSEELQVYWDDAKKMMQMQQNGNTENQNKA